MRVEIEESYKYLRIVVRNDFGDVRLSLSVDQAHDLAEQLRQAVDAHRMLYPKKEDE